MSKVVVWIVGIVVVAVISITGTVLILGCKKSDSEDENLSTQQETEEDTPVDTSAEDTIYLFFSLINGKQIGEAISMMTENMVGTDPTQSNSEAQQWGVVFSSWNGVEVQGVQKVTSEEEDASKVVYKVMLFLEMSEGGLGDQWAEGPNLRLVTLAKVDGEWKIDDIAMGS